MSRSTSPSTSTLGLALALALLFAATGCEQVFQRSSERKSKEAQAMLDLKDYKAAVLLFEASLDGTPESAPTHYKLGMIYDDNLKQPFGAIHHFQRYLELAPEGRNAEDARNYIREDQLKVMAASGNGATVPQQEAVRLKNENLSLGKQVLELRKELDIAHKARVEALKAAGLKADSGQLQKPLIPGVRTYTVQRGDTLGSISRKFYKSPERWRDIQDVNFNTQSGTAQLKPGMVLMIP